MTQEETAKRWVPQFALLARYYFGDQMWEDELGEECRMDGRDEKCL